jgi:hypothetical protein
MSLGLMLGMSYEQKEMVLDIHRRGPGAGGRRTLQTLRRMIA